MDERQAQIKEGEGLTESRVNQEFIDLLQKYGMHALLIVAILALGYRGWQWMEQRRVDRVNEAFRQLELAGGPETASPDILRTIARDFEGVRGVEILARLRAADAYMVAVRRGVFPGAIFNQDGTLENPDEALDEEARLLQLDNAEREYQIVRQKAQQRPAFAIHEINALYGLAAVAESRGEFDNARAFYEDVIEVAEEAGLAPHPEIARERIASIDGLDEAPQLFAQAELPPLPWAELETPEEDGATEDAAGGEGAEDEQANAPADPPADDAGGAEQGAGGDDGNAGDPDDGG